MIWVIGEENNAALCLHGCDRVASALPHGGQLPGNWKITADIT
ncbi:hypothetical protein BRYFOR_08625 [Marvinbryantia formatexigens DSM 14469]|uniref:Uncharacterized protein n=1 Tax=Marvinbryantia formatexigens DSM 14469 TaxID=478749 RepID=C6LIZ1_9FIRM|nr:hypothetical protein BRYFOR_08625 [Marvinbryantia formatexigens DSM 14469]